MPSKSFSDISYEDFSINQVWQHKQDNADGISMMSPVRKRPLKSLTRKLLRPNEAIGPSGLKFKCIVTNIEVPISARNDHFVELIFFNSGDCGLAKFTLPRYHDIDFRENGPEKLAEWIGVDGKDIFPLKIIFNTGLFVNIHKNIEIVYRPLPLAPLSRSELIDLALE